MQPVEKTIGNNSGDPPALTIVDSVVRLARTEAAAYLTSKGLKVAASSLAAKAVDGSGPRYRVRGNRATYAIVDLDAWANDRLGPSVASTAERIK